MFLSYDVRIPSILHTELQVEDKGSTFFQTKRLHPIDSNNSKKEKLQELV